MPERNILDQPILPGYKVLELVTEALKTKEKGALFLRFGDGEYISLFYAKDPTFLLTLRKYQWDFEPSLEQLEAVRVQIEKTLPLIRYFGIKLWGKMKKWDLIADDNWEFQKRIDFDFHSLLLNVPVTCSILIQWFELAPQIGIISSRTKTAKVISQAFPNKKVIHYSIPSEGRWHKTFPEKEDSTGIHHYPDYVNKICKALSKTVIPTGLWIVGAGIFKFFYAEIIYKKGGVCVDVGSALDWWDGKITRGKKDPARIAEPLTLEAFQKAKLINR